MDEDIRVGDADRERVISTLEGHSRAGRLGMDELLERSSAAYAARTRAELAALTGDLPAGPGETGGPAGPAGPASHRGGAGGTGLAAAPHARRARQRRGHRLVAGHS